MVIHVSFKKKEHVERMIMKRDSLLSSAVCVARLHIPTLLCFASVFFLVFLLFGEAIQRFFESACARGATAQPCAAFPP
jgi:hypothetical protein